MLPALLGILPSIVSLFTSKDKSAATQELTKSVVNEANKALGLNAKNQDELLAHLQNVPEDLYKLKELDTKYESEINKLIFDDKQSARKMAVELSNATSWLLKNTGSMIAIFTVLAAGMLDAYILREAFSFGVEALNPIVTLIAGHVSARAGQVLSFYFGSSKEQADSKRAEQFLKSK